MTVFFLIYRRYISIFQLIRDVEFLMFSLKDPVKASAIMSKFHLRILAGILPFRVTFLLFTLLISLFTPSTLKYLNKSTFGSLKYIFICKILRRFLCFLISFSTGSASSIASVSKLPSFLFLILWWRYWRIH